MDSADLVALARQGHEAELVRAVEDSGLPVDTVEPDTKLSALCVAAEVCAGRHPPARACPRVDARCGALCVAGDDRPIGTCAKR